MWKYRDLGARGESKSGQMDSDDAIKPEPLLTERGQGGQGSWLKGVPGQRADQSPGASPSGQLYKRGHASEVLRTSASLLIKGGVHSARMAVLLGSSLGIWGSRRPSSHNSLGEQGLQAQQWMEHACKVRMPKCSTLHCSLWTVWYTHESPLHRYMTFSL